MLFSKVFFLTLIAGVAGALIADKKGRNWILWGLICAIVPFLLLLLILLSSKVRPGMAIRCPFCGKPTQEGLAFCGQCGRELPIELVRCPNCGKYVPLKDYCAECNKSLRA